MTRREPLQRDRRIDDLDGIARELARAAGYEAAETLILAFGGQRLYVPVKMRPSSPFWRVLGADAAKKLAAIANANLDGVEAQGAGRDVDIPLGSRLMMAKRKAAIGQFKGSKNRAAEIFKCSRRTIQRYRRHLRQPDLFEGLSKR